MPRPHNIIAIVDGDSGEVPFSKGVFAQSLTATGLAPGRAYELAKRVESILRQRRSRTISMGDLHALAIEVLGREESDAVAQRFRRWTILKRKDVPIVILIGGTTGSGKSTVASQLAHRLGITRVTSTDMIRQVMRAFFSPALMPVLHHSSFDMPVSGILPDSSPDAGLLGFIEQARQVSAGAQAVVERAERERMSTLIEGVHLIPGQIHHLDLAHCAVVEVVVYVEDEETHRGHFTMRGLQTDGGRPTDHYLHSFDRIRMIQEYLVLQAERRGVPVLENSYIDATVSRLMDHTLNVVEQVALEAERLRSTDPHTDVRTLR